MILRRQKTGCTATDTSQVFRQFAWNIAGVISQNTGKKTKPARHLQTRTTLAKITPGKSTPGKTTSGKTTPSKTNVSK